ncbi:MAG: PDZ domain-containing protein [Thermoguttaceae bacterium]|jgi:serine protease Do
MTKSLVPTFCVGTHCLRRSASPGSTRSVEKTGFPRGAWEPELILLPCLLALAAWALAAPPARGDDDLETLQQKAVAAALQRVAPSVVRIETVGGLERVQKVLFGTGPTTGVVVDPQGYIVSSAFNFVNKPASILVRLPGGARKPAKLVATDHSRKIVLLKIEVDHPLPVPEVAPESEMRVGQWCIAVGRTFEEDRPNLAVGILSAVGRIWGKALQTDAAVSPNNYGGPLVDIRGRVLGILVPLSPQSADEIAGYEWYDSGIGFAVPLEHILTTLPRLRKGEDLRAGVGGFMMKARNLYTGDTEIASCRPRSPADKAGFKAGDRLIEIGGRTVSRSAEVRQEISRHYAGQKLHFVALRGKERIERDLELSANLDPFRYPFLGILPSRDAAKAPAGGGAAAKAPGVAVRYVYPQTPAAAAHIEPGDVVLSVGGQPAGSRDELLRQVAGFEAGEEVPIEFRHGSETRKVKVKLADLPEGLPPAELPPPSVSGTPRVPPAAGATKSGAASIQVPEFKNEAWAYVPEGYSPAVPCGLVVWLHGAAVPKQDELLGQWKPLCDRYGLVLVAPKAAGESGWRPDETAFLEKLVRQVQASYAIDPARVVVGGRGPGGTLAYMAAFHSRDFFRAAVAIDAVAMFPPPESDPEHRLALYVATAKKSPMAAAVAQSIVRLRAAKLPVTEKDLGDAPRDLNPAELAELARWIDMLDRI